LIQQNSRNILNMYYNHREKDDISNFKLMEPGQSMTIGGNTLLVVKGTFMIMDEILFRNPDFDRKHNVNAIAENNIPEPIYHTIKSNCLQLEKEIIQLTWVQTIQFYLLLDIALQMLLGEHSDTLQTALGANNFTPFRQQEFIEFGSLFYDNLNKSLKESGSTIGNFKDRKNWSDIIR
jgi:hypothetical protein